MNTTNNALNVFCKRGRLSVDPRGSQVTMQWKGVTLLGDVVDVRWDSGFFHLVVRHFNGESWPIEPVLSVCRVLECTYG